MQSKIFQNPKDLQGLNVNRIACQYAHFIGSCRELGVPYSPYKESSPTFDDLVLDCIPYICGKCPREVFDRILEVVVAYPNSKRAMLALLAFPVTMFDGDYHENATIVLQLVARFCLCNGYELILDVDAIKKTSEDQLTPEHLAETIGFSKFYQF